MATRYGSHTIRPAMRSGSAGGAAGHRWSWKAAGSGRDFFQRLYGSRPGAAAGGIPAGFIGRVAERRRRRRGELVCIRRSAPSAARRRSGRGNRPRFWVLPAGGIAVGTRPGEHDRGASAQRDRRTVGARPGVAMRTCCGRDRLAAAARWPHVSAAAVGGRSQRRRRTVGTTGGGPAGTFVVARAFVGHPAADAERRVAVRSAIAARARGAGGAHAAGRARADHRGRRPRERRVS